MQLAQLPSLVCTNTHMCVYVKEFAYLTKLAIPLIGAVAHGHAFDNVACPAILAYDASAGIT